MPFVCAGRKAVLRLNERQFYSFIRVSILLTLTCLS